LISSAPIVFLVEESLHGSRLDQFLSVHLQPLHSRSQIASFIKQGAVLINNKPALKPGGLVHGGDTIAITIPQPPLSSLEPQAVDFEVLAEEKDFLIINKPAGLVVHQSTSSPGDITLVHGLLHRYPEFAQFESNERPGIVHRLDKDTSGLLVVARNSKALTALGAAFKSRQVTKEYHAIVKGHPPLQGTLTGDIGRHPVNRHMMCIGGIAPRNAHTQFEVISYYTAPAALLKVSILTGRTHQIRVHCAAEGFPVVGDATYGTATHMIRRQALHAHTLSFTYEGRTYSYCAPYPEDFAALLARLTLEEEK